MEEFLKWLDDMIGELNDKNSTLKISYNGKPVVDIENGKDMLKKDEPEKCEEKCTPNTIPTKDINNSYVADNTYDNQAITKYVYKDPDEETYYVRESANGARISRETPIIFDFVAKDGIVNPGVTDADLAFILLYRNRDNKVRYNALMDFIKNL